MGTFEGGIFMVLHLYSAQWTISLLNPKLVGNTGNRTRYLLKIYALIYIKQNVA